MSQNKENPQEFDYLMLSRLQEDCDYFLGNGNGCIEQLSYGNIEDHINNMMSLWNKLIEKPEWLSSQDILDYKEKMLNIDSKKILFESSDEFVKVAKTTIFLTKDNKIIQSHFYNGVNTITVLIKNVPKNPKLRFKRLKEIEEKANLNSVTCKTDYATQCENYHSRRNNYERQWTGMAILVYGATIYGDPNCDYTFTDILA